MKYLITVFLLAAAFTSTNAVFAPFGGEAEATTIVMTGDAMLGRAVEGLSLVRGFDYPFLHTKDFFSGADSVFVNLEGPIPEKHERTPSYSFRFSFRPEMIAALRASGVDIVTLANNHTLDAGESGYAHTVTALKKEEIDFVGHPVRIGEGLTFQKTIRGREVRFVGLNDTYSPLKVEKVSAMIRELKKENTFVIIAIHWGEEYRDVSNKRQQTLGRALIDAGADVVIGHHPHVVEEIELYRGKPIFYSLGNFIFDQSFSEETQQGLVVRIGVQEKVVSYELIPIDLHRAQPKRMSSELEGKWLESLSRRSANELRSGIAKGSFLISR